MFVVKDQSFRGSTVRFLEDNPLNFIGLADRWQTKAEGRFFESECGSRRVISFKNDWQGEERLGVREGVANVEVVPGFGWGFNSDGWFL